MSALVRAMGLREAIEETRKEGRIFPGMEEEIGVMMETLNYVIDGANEPYEYLNREGLRKVTGEVA